MAQKNILTGLHLGQRMFYLADLPMLHGGSTCYYRDEGIRLIISCFIRNGIVQHALLPDLKYFFCFNKAFTSKYLKFYYTFFCYIFEHELEWCGLEEDPTVLSWHHYVFINFSFFTFWIFKNNEWYIIYCQMYIPQAHIPTAKKIYRKLSKHFIKYYFKCNTKRVRGSVIFNLNLKK